MASSLQLKGKGSFGCVFKGLECDNDADIRKNIGEGYVTKAFKKDENGEKEIIEYTKLKQLFIKKKIMNPEKNFILNSERCLLQKKNDDFRSHGCDADVLISYEDGGDSLKDVLSLSDSWVGKRLYNVDQYIYEDNVKPDKLFYKNIFASLLNVLEGVHKLNSNQIYLFDLKPENIVYNAVKSKIIDLGSCKALDISTLDKDIKAVIRDSGGTPQYLAPEMYIISDDKGNVVYYPGIYRPNKLISLTVDNKILNLKFKNDMGSLINTETVVDSQPFDYYKTLDDRQRFVKNDMWAFGLILLEVLDLMREELEYLKGKETEYKEFYPMSEEDEYKKFQDIYKDPLDTTLLEELILNLLKLEVAERFDSKKALKLYKKWLILQKIIPETKSTIRSRGTNKETLRTKSAPSRLNVFGNDTIRRGTSLYTPREQDAGTRRKTRKTRKIRKNRTTKRKYINKHNKKINTRRKKH